MSGEDLRAKRRRKVRHGIRAAALRLFAEHGYGDVTVQRIAAAADVSTSTFFRHFATKEALVLCDEDDDRVFLESFEAQPPDLPPFEAARRAYREGHERLAGRELQFERWRIVWRAPELRAATMERNSRIAETLLPWAAERLGAPAEDLAVRSFAALCVAANGSAVQAWVDSDGTAHLPGLIDQAFAHLQSPPDTRAPAGNGRSRPSRRLQDGDPMTSVIQAPRPHLAPAMTRAVPQAAAQPSAGAADPIYQRLLDERIIFLGQEVDDDVAGRVTAQLLMLATDPDLDIHLYINSPGGSVTAGMAIYDTMQYIRNDVVTIAMGFCASMGQFLLSAGTKGKRFALPHTKILMHQPSAGLSGVASDIRIYTEHLLRTKREMAELIARHSGQDVETVIRDSDRDRWFTAEEARDYGLIDAVLESPVGPLGGRDPRS